ncbi:unnamed protein product [Linum tenue]|uniref:Uncharacterized protein n=1 Tax=Linum tenue TaxID=586396 RepID=A0AAV0HBZ8_9ROSI|nr:unnamed protein product [Linum tenue]CAI0382649.1 unnamed protein product [Linum tenue]
MGSIWWRSIRQRVWGHCCSLD